MPCGVSILTTCMLSQCIKPFVAVVVEVVASFCLSAACGGASVGQTPPLLLYVSVV